MEERGRIGIKRKSGERPQKQTNSAIYEEKPELVSLGRNSMKNYTASVLLVESVFIDITMRNVFVEKDMRSNCVFLGRNQFAENSVIHAPSEAVNRRGPNTLCRFKNPLRA